MPRYLQWGIGIEEDWLKHTEGRVAAVEERVRRWWEQYAHDSFHLLVPYRKWKDISTSLDLGAIVLVRYSSRFAQDRYRLGRVLELRDGRDGLVRTVLVGLWNLRRGAREPRGVCKAGLTTLVLPVQRLVLILPGADQPKEVIDQLREKAWLQKEMPSFTQGALKVRDEQEQEEILDLVG